MKSRVKPRGVDPKRCPHWIVRGDVVLQMLHACTNCGTTFVSAATYDVATHIIAHLADSMARMASESVKDQELRAIAHTKIREHIIEAARGRLENRAPQETSQ